MGSVTVTGKRELALGHGERAFLSAHLTKLVAWDSRALVRLQTKGAFLGVFAAPPMEVVTFIGLPMAGGDATEGLDRIVSAGRLRDCLGSIESPTQASNGVKSMGLPDEAGPDAILAALPPAGPWNPSGRATAAELMPAIEGATSEFRVLANSVPEGPNRQVGIETLAAGIWNRPSWSALPMRVLHTARLLGMLSHPSAQVASGTCLGWKRLVTPSGQVFCPIDGQPGRIPLSVIR